MCPERTEREWVMSCPKSKPDQQKDASHLANFHSMQGGGQVNILERTSLRPRYDYLICEGNERENSHGINGKFTLKRQQKS